MTPEKWQRAKEIFHAAFDMSMAERANYIQTECEGDEILFAEITELFSAHSESDSLLEKPALKAIKDIVSENQYPTRIGQMFGAYKIESEIGRGGMGAVYLASRADDEFDKRVAIKLIKRGFDTDEIIRRFRHERQILAGLEHPNIGRLLDGGSTDDGLPFLVMEHVVGKPLSQYAKDANLTLDGRLEIFLQICSAVSCAHQNLVIHRDLKPSNILVTDEGVPKLLDFGIAKLTASDSGNQTIEKTAMAFRAMTPEYASPEQVGGLNVSTASDIYSLGVILYELLTGHRPFSFRSRTAEEINRVLSDTIPTKPSSVCRLRGVNIGLNNEKTLIRNLQGDLDNIVLMAMRREAVRRYSSVDQFADDIRRYLSGLPVIAREDTFAYRTSKFVIRNKASVAAGLGIAVSLIGGLIASSRQARIASRQRDLARQEARKAEKINQFLKKMLASADPHEQGKDVKVIEVLENAAAGVETGFADQPAIKADLHNTIGTTYLHLGLVDQAESQLRKALKIRSDHFPHTSHEVAESLMQFGLLLQTNGELNIAEPYFAEASEIYRRLGAFSDVATALHEYGYLLVLNGKPHDAVDVYKRSLAIRRRLYGNEHPDVAKTLGRLAQVSSLLFDRHAAERYHRRALEILRRTLSDDHPDVLSEMTDLASSMMWRDRDEAEALFKEALELKRLHLGEFHPEVAWTLYEMAFLNVERHDYVKAEEFATSVLAMREHGLKEEHPAVNSSLMTLGRSFLEQGRLPEARSAFEECLSIRERTLVDDHWVLATTRSIYGECLFRLGEVDLGCRLMIESYHRLHKKFGTDHDRTKAAFVRLKRFEIQHSA